MTTPLTKVLYTAVATSTGGRDGKSVSSDGLLEVRIAPPKELGGPGGASNPEQLFAMGYASCYGQALLALGRKHGLDGGAARVTVRVTLDKDEISFALKVDIEVSLPGADRDKVQALADEAHVICPYSRATRNNVPSTVTVV